MSELTDFLLKKLPQQRQESREALKWLEDAWSSHRGIADPDFVSEFTSGDDEKFHQRFWEMLLTRRIEDWGLSPIIRRGGPDVTVEKDGVKLHLEAIAPSPGSGADAVPRSYLVPAEITVGEAIVAQNVPHEQILLRWTSAIAEKGKKYAGYLKSGVVANNDCCVIAINSLMLGHDGFIGISQWPAAVEATHPFGPIEVLFNQHSLEIVEQRLAYKPAAMKINRSPVSKDGFWGSEYQHISAILACQIDYCAPFGSRRHEPIVVHNINANVPLPKEAFPSVREYWVERTENLATIRSNEE